MNTEILGVILQWVALVVLCYPLGRYIAKVYRGERTWLDFMAPVERFVYRVCGIDPAQEMDWKQFLKALLMVNLFWFFWGMLLLVFQGWLPLNPDGNPGQSPDLAFNTCISFMVNCNLQHYSGETGLSYFTQLFVIMLFQFVTAACGMAAMAGVMKALAAKTTKTIGNFWVFLTKSVTRILMPLSLVVGILLVINGTPMSFDGKQTITTLEGQEQVISQGPTAAIVPIKQLGTNGGGYFGTNSAHPLENPNAFTNILECWSILILPMAMAFAFGFYTRRRRLAAWIFAVMLFAYIAGVVFSVWQETGGSRQIDRMGIEQKLKDGDEVLFTCESTNSVELLFFTNHRQVYKSHAYDFNDSKASVLGDYVASALGMEEGEVPLYMVVTPDYKGWMLFFYDNGKCAKVPLSSYETKQNRRKLLKAYSDKAELAFMRHLPEETELAIFTTNNRLLLVGSALIPEKTTRDTAGVSVVALKKNAKIARVTLAEGLELNDAPRYRVRTLPAAGAILKDDDRAEQLTL